MTMIRRLREEAGSALIAAMLVMTAIMALGLAMLAVVDTQTRQSAKDRGRESTFNWAEAALNAQTFTAARYWPARADQAIADCTWNGSGSATAATSATNPVNACPTPDVISTTFGGNLDVVHGATWTTQVRDNAGSSACEDSSLSNCSYTWDDRRPASDPQSPLNAPHWDANGDNLLWLRASGVVNGDRRIVVGLVRIQSDPLSLPQSVVVAGSLHVQGGNKTFIEQNGSSVTVRCTNIADPACYSEQKPGVNVMGPGDKQPGYADGGHILTADELDSLRYQAQKVESQTPYPRYYGPGDCPASAAAMSAPVVFIEDADCKIEANWVINSKSAPGMLVVNKGTLTFNGTMDFYGVVYMYNAQNSNLTLFDGTGNGAIHGSLLVDGPGRVDNTGSWSLDYDPNAINSVTTFGAAGIVPNSFREINP